MDDSAGLPREIREQLQDAYRKAFAFHIKAQDEVRTLAAILCANGVEVPDVPGELTGIHIKCAAKILLRRAGGIMTRETLINAIIGSGAADHVAAKRQNINRSLNKCLDLITAKDEVRLAQRIR